MGNLLSTGPYYFERLKEIFDGNSVLRISLKDDKCVCSDASNLEECHCSYSDCLFLDLDKKLIYSGEFVSPETNPSSIPIYKISCDNTCDTYKLKISHHDRMAYMKIKDKDSLLVTIRLMWIMNNISIDPIRNKNELSNNSSPFNYIFKLGEYSNRLYPLCFQPISDTTETITTSNKVEKRKRKHHHHSKSSY